jgi:hypothetical protein
MKKDRCNSNYPVYPTYPINMMPGIPSMGGMPFDMPNTYNYTANYNQGSSSLEQQVSSLNSQVSSLERRISNLENLVGSNSNKYNTSNFQML